ncbi:hypothetical protein Rhopal_002298-T1 [Rhodotorula paludigena]|uniref:O-acyltransferase n=1 Tax=Rhodotorula paludigena TaxID=86838 RepID=A0AAV5GKX4_9BASI|nr:hypothetical protein Rhopal_002298-T1 [Rhodotorula paludigena]
MARAKAPPPGPANLVDEALHAEPAPSPPPARRTREMKAPPLVAQASKASSLILGGSGTATPDLAQSSDAATTTITTIEGDQAVTETFTHTGVDHVDAKFSSSGQITLKPIPAKGGDPKKIRLVRARRTRFTPRTSHFDRHNALSAADQFRGFWTLFWIVIAVFAFRTIYRRFSETGGVLGGWRFAALISEDAWALALSDAVLVGSTLLCVPFVKLIVNGWIRYYWAGLVIQHIAQTLFLAITVRWTFHRSWPWVQSGFLTLHALSMLMKVHSYCALNGELSERRRQLKKDSAALDKATEELGGRGKLEQEGRDAWEKACIEESAVAEDVSATTSIAPSATNAALRQRHGDRLAAASQPSSSDKDGATRIRQRPAPNRRRSISPSTNRHPPLHPSRDDAPHDGVETLTWHPNERISKLAIGICEAQEALSSGGVANVQWPDNVTFLNFIDYLLVPTLVYELEYPRTDSIRPLYVLEKTLATFGTFSLLILIVEHFIYPVMPTPEVSFFSSVIDLATPFSLCYILIWYIIFECICNGFAEITRFSDREFYSDWWNSTSFDEFSRKWNIPVHTFLLRHVYATTIATYRLSRFSAAFVTFLLSACVHELVMAVVSKKIRIYLFAMQMIQLPLIMIGRAKIFKRNPALGNLFFWLGLLSGFPLLAVLYVRH